MRSPTSTCLRSRLAGPTRATVTVLLPSSATRSMPSGTPVSVRSTVHVRTGPHATGSAPPPSAAPPPPSEGVATERAVLLCSTARATLVQMRAISNVISAGVRLIPPTPPSPPPAPRSRCSSLACSCTFSIDTVLTRCAAASCLRCSASRASVILVTSACRVRIVASAVARSSVTSCSSPSCADDALSPSSSPVRSCTKRSRRPCNRVASALWRSFSTLICDTSRSAAPTFFCSACSAAVRVATLAVRSSLALVSSACAPRSRVHSACASASDALVAVRSSTPIVSAWIWSACVVLAVASVSMLSLYVLISFSAAARRLVNLRPHCCSIPTCSSSFLDCAITASLATIVSARSASVRSSFAIVSERVLVRCFKSSPCISAAAFVSASSVFKASNWAVNALCVVVNCANLPSAAIIFSVLVTMILSLLSRPASALTSRVDTSSSSAARLSHSSSLSTSCFVSLRTNCCDSSKSASTDASVCATQTYICIQCQCDCTVMPSQRSSLANKQSDSYTQPDEQLLTARVATRARNEGPNKLLEQAHTSNRVVASVCAVLRASFSACNSSNCASVVDSFSWIHPPNHFNNTVLEQSDTGLRAANPRKRCVIH
eukprot:m.978194 g.978194  ORF g.978194 m.978194 type:complete len:606 (+) comp23955_c1_seq12:167-1984(+)